MIEGKGIGHLLKNHVISASSANEPVTATAHEDGADAGEGKRKERKGGIGGGACVRKRRVTCANQIVRSQSCAPSGPQFSPRYDPSAESR